MDSKPGFITKFIEIYRDHPCLWKVKHHSYSNKQIKDDAYGLLLDLYKNTIPSATIDTVKKKINNLRCTFRKEYKKVKQAKLVNESYTPSLWYYELLLFTEDQEKSRITDSEEEITINNHKQEIVWAHIPSTSPPPPAPWATYTPATSVPSRKMRNDERNREQETIDASRCSKEDEFDGIGINVACKLRRMDEDQRLYAELLISKVLLHGIRGTLQGDSDIVL